jgi:CRISPR-associated endonuclease/helicase Cas3
VLFPVYADLWATTSPAPPATPEPALFLHGRGVSADVQVIWRADVSPEGEEWANRSLEICPPSSLEAMSVPIWAVRRWLRSAQSAALADVPEPEPGGERPGPGRACLRRDGDRWVKARAEQARPGDTIVVPCAYGGCDAYGWNPECRDEVSDLGAEAHYRQRLRGALRVSKATVANALAGDADASAQETWRRILQAIPDEDAVDPEAVRSGLLQVEDLPETWARLLAGMADRRLRFASVSQDDPSAGFAISAEKRLPRGLLKPTEEDEETPGDEARTDFDNSSAIGVAVGLDAHLGHVEAKARGFAAQAGLPESLVAVVALAARMHDLGKADPRFQSDLRGASSLARQNPMLAAMLAARQGELLAKSVRARAGGGAGAAPEGFRHEALSVALAERHPDLAKLSEDERALLLWLVGTHHGWGRPFFPPPKDSAPETEAALPLDGAELAAQAGEAPLRLDQGWFERVERLRRTYGPWELARLEAILRLADHAASAEEQEGVAPSAPSRRSARAAS